MKTQPPGLQTDLVTCSRETREWILSLVDEIERLKAIIAADDAYFAITARAAFKMIRGPLTESFHAEQAAVWEKCKSTRKAAEAAGGE